jgi:hypothetical protein
MSAGLFFHHISLAALEDAKVADISRSPTLALLPAAAQDGASVFALFGGQANEVYFDELQSLYDIYTPYVTPLIPPITDEILKPLASAREATSFYAYYSESISPPSSVLPQTLQLQDRLTRHLSRPVNSGTGGPLKCTLSSISEGLIL